MRDSLLVSLVIKTESANVRKNEKEIGLCV